MKGNRTAYGEMFINETLHVIMPIKNSSRKKTIP